MTRILLFLMILLQLPALSLAGERGAELLIRRTPVPADPPYQGEVRVLRRDSAQVVQTILNSKVMNRVVAAIREKESQDWPKEREGALDSRRYTEELVLAYQALRERSRERQKRGEDDRYLQLLIEFVVEGKQGYVALYAPTLTREGEKTVIGRKELLKKLPLSYTYLRKNMQFIVEDSFRLEPEEAQALLQQAAGER